jgi:hypothetical protein
MTDARSSSPGVSDLERAIAFYRPHYGPTYYAAFVIDPDGYPIEAVCQQKRPKAEGFLRVEAIADAPCVWR